MANIRVDVDYQIVDGQPLTFIAPCPCTEVDGLTVYYPIGQGQTLSKEFIFNDAHGNDLSDVNNLFNTNVYVKVILNTRNGVAYIQNADTNAYLEGKFKDIKNTLSGVASIEHTHTFEELEGVAPSGYGYGEKMVWLGFDESSWTSTGNFQSDLETVFNAMPQGTCKQVQFIDSTLHTQKFTGVIWKYTNDYGYLTATNYSGLQAIKCMYGGVWNPWEWVNPPMADGVEYRTTKRHKGKPVYAMAVNIGAMPANSSATINISVSGSTIDEIVAIDVFAKSSNIYKLPFVDQDGKICAMFRTSGSRSVFIKTFSSLSGYTGKIVAEYTKA